MRSGNTVRMHRRAGRESLLLAVIFSLAVSAMASATVLVPGVTMTLQYTQVGSGSVQGPIDIPLNWVASSGTISIFQSPGNAAETYGAAEVKYSVLVNTDPAVTHNIVLTNNTAVAQAYMLSVNLPLGTGPVAAPTVVGGSIDIDVQDETGDGAVLGVIDDNTPIYLATTDSGFAQPLLMNMPALTPGAYLTANANATFGTPIPSLPGPVAVTNWLAIQLAFTLTPGDTATVVSNFVLEGQIIPEPASLTLVGLGAGILLIRRRKPR